MPVEVIMPKVDMDMATGRIARWHVADGGRVEKNAALFDIETDKATMEVEAPAAGRLHHIRAATGEDIPVGQPVAWLYADGEPLGPAPALAPRAPSSVAPSAADPAPATAPSPGRVRTAPVPVTPVPVAPDPVAPDPVAPDRTEPAPTRPAVRATPLARRLARERALDLGAVKGTSLRGRVTRSDVEAALLRTPPPSASPAEGELALTRAGNGDRTPILLLHGFAADSAGWAMLEGLLPPGHPVLKLDLPAHGRSPRQPVASFADLAQCARRAIDGLGDGPLHLVGHSLGGAVAIALADTRPRRVASLTLIAPAGLGPEIDAAVLAGIARASRVESLAPWLRRLAADPDLITDAYARAAMAARQNLTLREAQSAMAADLFPDGTQGFDLTAALHRIRAPTRIAWGRDDAIIPWRHALRAPGRVGLHLFEATGHLPHIERPHEIAMLVMEMTQLRAASD